MAEKMQSQGRSLYDDGHSRCLRQTRVGNGACGRRALDSHGSGPERTRERHICESGRGGEGEGAHGHGHGLSSLFVCGWVADIKTEERALALVAYRESREIDPLHSRSPTALAPPPPDATAARAQQEAGNSQGVVAFSVCEIMRPRDPTLNSFASACVRVLFHTRK